MDDEWTFAEDSVTAKPAKEWNLNGHTFKHRELSRIEREWQERGIFV